jgi:hypothetical protein
MGYSLLRHREIPCNTRALTSTKSKGNEVNIPQVECGGNVATQMSLETSVCTPGRVLFSS